MEKKLGIGIVSVLLMWFSVAFSFAGTLEPSLNQLIEESKQFDGKTVTVSGEVLVEAMERDSNAWININDGTNAMGIFMPIEAIKKISHYGNYQTTGDTIKIQAVFNRSCKDHGGDMDLHFVKYIEITPGSDREMTVNPFSIWIAIGLTILTIGIVVYYLAISGQFERINKYIKYFRLKK